MNKEVIKDWVVALRSGNYKQGVERLKKGDEFCCLGVLCDLYAKTFKNEWSKVEDCNYEKFFKSSESLPGEVCNWVGLDSDPFIKEQYLSGWNDIDKKDFNYIADLIENEYLK